MIKVDLLLELVELKKQEIDDCKNDFNTLTSIIASLEAEMNQQQSVINEFVNDCINNQYFNMSAPNMMNGRAYLHQLNLKSNEIMKSKKDAEVQKDSAFDSLKEAVLALKKLTKIIEKIQKNDLEETNRKALLIDDTLELYRHNNKA
ncbi:MAG: hypothetical protein ACMZ63_06245 [Methylotenera sp.]